jgi:hypothetical protein
MIPSRTIPIAASAKKKGGGRCAVSASLVSLVAASASEPFPGRIVAQRDRIDRQSPPKKSEFGNRKTP